MVEGLEELDPGAEEGPGRGSAWGGEGKAERRNSRDELQHRDSGKEIQGKLV